MTRKLIQNKDFEEGEFFCKWLYSRLLKNNKNVLTAELGGTGSGKSYRDLRKAELWYKYYLKKPFPVENICFGVGDLMRRLTSGKLVKGEILIFEEAGANLGSLDFQDKICKMFTYVLQSFRSMNIAIFFNLPYLSMLNKQARMLIHYSGESLRIDYEKQKNICKGRFHQTSQVAGKTYRKKPKVKLIGRRKSMKIKTFSYNMPSPELALAYEQKKAKYLSESQESFMKEIAKREQDSYNKMQRANLTPKQLKTKELLEQGLTQKEIAEEMGVDSGIISRRVGAIKKKGYKIEDVKK